MGFIGSVLGTSSGNKGSAGLNYNASGTNIQQAVTPAQLSNAADAQLAAQQQQNQFLQALQSQNGIGNQTAAYNQYAALAQGQGPQVGQTQLNTNTAQNVANQAALMASQRGASANTGLIARQAAQQGAATQQQAVGQAATLGAQQQLAALQGQAGLATQQVGQQQQATQFSNQAAQNEQAQLLQSVAAYNAAQVGMQSNINNANAGIAGIAAQGQQNFMGNILGGIGAALAHGGMVKNYDQGGSVEDASPSPSPKPTSQNPQATKEFVNGFKKALGYADGGNVQGSGSFLSNFSKGFNTSNQNYNGQSNQIDLLGSPNQKPSALSKGTNQFASGAISVIKNLLSSKGSMPVMAGGAADASQMPMNQAADPTMATSAPMMAAKGGKVPALVSPGEVYIPPNNVKAVVEKKVDPIKAGKKVPGQAKVKGDSLKNDTVKASLDVGGMVIPRSVVNSKNPHNAIYNFVNKELAKSLKRPKKK